MGIVPKTYAEGVLQDVHWSGGGFGYFPSYSLGNMYAAQFMHTIKREIPEFDRLIEQGNFQPVKAWLIDNIYRHGKLLTPAEIVQNVTGEPLTPSYLIDYLETKFKDIYRL